MFYSCLGKNHACYLFFSIAWFVYKVCNCLLLHKLKNILHVDSWEESCGSYMVYTCGSSLFSCVHVDRDWSCNYGAKVTTFTFSREVDITKRAESWGLIASSCSVYIKMRRCITSHIFFLAKCLWIGHYSGLNHL